uniref:Uncharacterized protein n=1 Tax=Kalanchoe fedtschenkoi TaxID=63787 RepID=A0A7N0ULL5_KALFE
MHNLDSTQPQGESVAFFQALILQRTTLSAGDFLLGSSAEVHACLENIRKLEADPFLPAQEMGGSYWPVDRPRGSTSTGCQAEYHETTSELKSPCPEMYAAKWHPLSIYMPCHVF